MNPHDMESVAFCLDRQQLLLWRMDLIRQTFHPLCHCPAILLSTENYRFFKDREFRRRLLHEDDLTTMEQAFQRFKERKPVDIVFRVRSNGTVHWFRLNGWPTRDPGYYLGGVADISDQLPPLQTMLEEHNRQLLEHLDLPYPVALFTWPGCILQQANPRFAELFGPAPDGKRRVQLADLLQGDLHLPALLETLISERRITTGLVLTARDAQASKMTCRLERFSYQGTPRLRLAVLDDTPHSAAPAPHNAGPEHHNVAELCRDLAGCRSIAAMLDRIYQSRQLFPHTDAVMFSDIYARRNKVLVYPRGTLKEDLEPGTQFPYTGTIAENIARENLEYLIVDDTQSSIKAIDWMLFVPKGLYSYMAKARYERGAMRTVLIVCSQRKSAFSEHQIAALTEITTAFHKQLKKIRRSGGEPERLTG